MNKATTAPQLIKVAEADLPTEFGLFRIYGFESGSAGSFESGSARGFESGSAGGFEDWR